MKYSNDDFFEIEYMRDQDKYALKSDEIVNKYVAIDCTFKKERRVCL